MLGCDVNGPRKATHPLPLCNVRLGGNFGFTRNIRLAQPAAISIAFETKMGSCIVCDHGKKIVSAFHFVMSSLGNCLYGATIDTLATEAFGKKEAVRVMISIWSVCGVDFDVSNY
jgi:hypothetical protein